MGNCISHNSTGCPVINNTTRDVIIKEPMKGYCKESKKVEEFSFDEELKPSEHACYNPSELKERQKMYKQLLGINSLEIVASFKDNSSREEVLSISEFETNAGIVLNEGKNNQLVKEPVSKAEAKKSRETKSPWKHKQEWKEHLISIVENRNTASTSQPQQGEGEEPDKSSQHDVTE